ncbi:MAG: hypothetical protein M3P89_03380 [Actinomycetota bacterium]|nr:hypothetical protein [Actinomycetota bacterium]
MSIDRSADDHPTGLPPVPIPSLEQDLAVLAWLQCSRELSQDATGYLIEALLQWALFDPSCPDPVPPSPATGHLELLKQIAVRWSERTAACQTVSRILGMGQVGRQINYAIRCECDPQGLADELWREWVSEMPWLAEMPAPIIYADGSVL